MSARKTRFNPNSALDKCGFNLTNRKYKASGIVLIISGGFIWHYITPNSLPTLVNAAMARSICSVSCPADI
jgi:hypothetical protein